MKTIVPLSSGDARKAVARFGRSPRTAAIPLLPANAGEAEWLAARRRDGAGGWRIGASELAAVLGISPHASPFSLWWSKQDSWVRPEATTGMRIGHKLEPVIGDLWAEAHPDMLLCRPRHALYGHPDPEHAWLVCTPDFLAVTTRPGCQCASFPMARGEADCPNHSTSPPLVAIEPVECKSDEGGQGWGAPGTDQVPAHHRVQVYAQSEILGAPRGHLMRLAGKRASAYVLPYDDAARAEMARWLEAGRRFVVELETGLAPDPDGHDATTATLLELAPSYVEGTDALLPAELAEAYRRLHTQLADVKTAFAAAQNQVRQRLGDAQLGVDADGTQVVKRLVYKRRAYEVPATVVDQLRRLS